MSLPRPPGILELRGPGRDALVEGTSRREGRVRRLGRMALLTEESVVVHLGPFVRTASIWSAEFGCKTIAVDQDAPSLAALAKEAEQRGVAALVEGREGDPLARPVAGLAAPVELIFAQGLAAVAGFDGALEAARPSLVTDGLLAVFQRTWIAPKVPDLVREYWTAHAVGAIRSVRDTLARFVQLGYEPMTCELIPAQAWDEHYEVAERQLAAIASGAGPETEAGKALASLREELKVHQTGGRDSTSVGCFVARRVEPDSPPRWPRRGASE